MGPTCPYFQSMGGEDTFRMGAQPQPYKGASLARLEVPVRFALNGGPGSPDTEKNKTPEYGSTSPPAEIVTGKRRRDALRMTKKVVIIRNNPLAQGDEAVELCRGTTQWDCTVKPHGGAAQRDCTVGLYSGTVQWDCIGEPHSGLHIGRHSRLTDRRFLRAYAPASVLKEPDLPGSQDVSMECGSDSAWGARGQINR